MERITSTSPLHLSGQQGKCIVLWNDMVWGMALIGVFMMIANMAFREVYIDDVAEYQ